MDLIMDRLTSAAFAGALALLAGCGTAGPSYPTATVEGVVTVAGQPLPADAEGTVTFYPTEGGGQASPAGSEIVDGAYQVEEAPIGDVSVVFNITRLTGRMVREDNIPTASPHAERENLVPPAVRQGVAIQVNANEMTRDFDL